MEPRATILIVDDSPENIDVLNGILKPYYRVKAALSGQLALKIVAGANKPDLILLDIMMPGMDGHEVCRLLKANPLTVDIPIIFITAKTAVEDEQIGLELGAVDYISKPVSIPIVLARVNTHLALYNQQRELELKVKERTHEIQQTRREIIDRLGRAAEYKDNETGMHVIRMSRYSKMLAEKIKAPDNWVDLLYNAAPMHDVGKIGIPDKILLKPGKLTPEEWQEMQKHVQYGADIIGNHESELLKMAREIALYHHEKYDGSGYPHGTVGDEIPLSARIVAIADVFDALTSERPYKTAWSLQTTFEYIQNEAGKHFDPELVPHFIACEEQIIAIKERFADSQSDAEC
ncbi:two-component system response regulator [Thalassotalea litorea]|uniref:Two-component system response regulator n=1 Tax=Thalassotalea litorea TaxID=2020715 RepID=A0A5R9INN8_9GAMM|nr:two-component system response regulator [Thalassotalea litorea]TLU61609.1 two-component system response regulator [Thalassotalea litorea]